MTTRRDYAPVLDRLIRREVTTEVVVPAATAYTYDEVFTGGGVTHLSDGTWIRNSDTELTIALEDSSGGLSFPDDLVTPFPGVEVSWDGATPTILIITDIEILLSGFTFVPLSLKLTFDGPLPAAGTALTLMVSTAGTQTVTQTTTVNVWAARRDYRGRDFLSASDIGRFPVTSTRFIVRAEGPAWVIGDIFTDDKGESQEVQGIGEVAGRGRYLELLTAG